MSIPATDLIVIAVEEIVTGIRNWRDKLCLTLSHTVDLDEAGIRQAFFSLEDGTFIELVAPAHDKSPLAGILERRSEGIHVMATEVDGPGPTDRDRPTASQSG